MSTRLTVIEREIVMFQGAIVTPNSLIVTYANKVYNAQSDHPNFGRLKAAFKAGDPQAFIDAFDVKTAVEKYVDGGETKDTGVTIVGNQILYNGQPVHNSVVDAIQRMLAEGYEITPMVKFLENMMENPSYNSIKEMWKFIEQMGLAITEDGCFLAYKSVNSDYTDKHTGTIDNRPGQKPERMKRSEVDDNPRNHCSKGYHVGALGYAGPRGWFHSYNDKVLICKVNPADVVSVPDDHSCQKMRCCYYEPVGEFQGELQGVVYSGAVGGDYSASAPTPKGFESECVHDEYNLLEDNYYIAKYTKSDGTTARRFFLVEEVNHANDTYTVLLVDPEEHEGEYRTFLMNRLNEVCTWDGETDPGELEDPWLCYDPYEDEDEEEEYCDYCGECDCDGYCEDEDEDDYNVGPSYW
jgi:hypothetical protein